MSAQDSTRSKSLISLLAELSWKWALVSYLRLRLRVWWLRSFLMQLGSTGWSLQSSWNFSRRTGSLSLSQNFLILLVLLMLMLMNALTTVWSRFWSWSLVEIFNLNNLKFWGWIQVEILKPSLIKIKRFEVEFWSCFKATQLVTSVKELNPQVMLCLWQCFVIAYSFPLVSPPAHLILKNTWTSSSWQNCALRDDEAVYGLSILQQW